MRERTRLSHLSPPAQAFVAARLGAVALPDYPGRMPETLDEAYLIQDAAIRSWPVPVAGWKVGRINGDDIARFGTDRLAGPIFKDQIYRAGTEEIGMPVFAGGFAAVEGECVIVAGVDAPAGKFDYTTAEAIALIGAIHAGVEIASSPFSAINDHGPLVTISDFGNNNGLLIGEELPDWRPLDFTLIPFETVVDGQVVGRADASIIPGGPIESFRFMLENAARRDMPLTRGMAISTGAVTGVHAARIGSQATVRAHGTADMHVRLVGANAKLLETSSR